MTKHGWKEGQSLGNRDSTHVGLNDAERLAASRVGILFKDDSLGLGAKRKSKDIEGQRVGLDAFQGLLGRLNGKSEGELRKEEKKVEDRKLEMYARGRWGGLVFVWGGVLVGSKKDEEDKEQDDGNDQSTLSRPPQDADSDTAAEAEKLKNKQEKRQRKEQRRKIREEKAARKLTKTKQSKRTNKTDDSEPNNTHSTTLALHKSPLTQPADEPVSSPSSASSPSPSDTETEKARLPPPVTKAPMRNNGRHLLRGRNIQAKRMAFSDTKGLDEIFMKTGR